MSSQYDHRPPDPRQSLVAAVRGYSQAVCEQTGVLCPTWREAVTIGSVPGLLLAIYFLLQRSFDDWRQLGYVRHAAAQITPANQIAPDPLIPHVTLWHELTRVSHVLIHAPGTYHTHVVGNALLIGSAAWALLIVLTALGRRRWFVYVYWELVTVAPIIGSFAFDLFGTTARGFGASTVGYAFLGVIAVVSVLALVSSRHGQTSQQSERCLDVDTPVSPVLVCSVLIIACTVVISDVVSGSPAMPVHQAGVGFGIVVGTFVVPLAPA